MSHAISAASSGDRNVARRNAVLLAASQAIVGSAAPIAISVGGLAGSYLLGPDKSLATAPVTAFTAGVAIGAVLAAGVMRLVGRRYGLMAGTLLTAGGGLLAVLALYSADFWLFAFALMVVGFGGAFVQQYRFAAADAAPVAFKPQAISLVLAGGVFAAIIGPQTVIHTRTALSPVLYAGCFAALVPLALIGMLVLSFLRVTDQAALLDDEGDEPARPLGEIVANGQFLTALACGVGAYALMTFMMTGAPLAMVGAGFSPDMAAWGIQWHVMAMYVPSFFTGRLILRFGKARIVALGFLLLLACAVVAHLGTAVWNFWLALILLGLGWNFGFIGSTAMVTSCYRHSEKNKVQGFHDVVLFSCVALASLASGKVLNAFGWNVINLLFLPVAIFCLALLSVSAFRAAERRKAA